MNGLYLAVYSYLKKKRKEKKKKKKVMDSLDILPRRKSRNFDGQNL